MQLSYAQLPRRRFGDVKLSRVFDHVSPAVGAAARAAADQLERLGIRHAFIGGIGVGAHGHVRSTDDVEFLVGEEAFEHHGALVTFKPGVPVNVGGVRIDYVSPANVGPAVEAALDAPVRSDGYPVAPIEVLVYTKLVARRRKDQADVVELAKSGADLRHVRGWLVANAADLVPLYDELVEQAEHER